MGNKSSSRKQDLFERLRETARINPTTKIYVTCQIHRTTAMICPKCLIGEEKTPFITYSIKEMEGHYRLAHKDAEAPAEHSAMRVNYDEGPRLNKKCVVCVAQKQRFQL